MTGWQKRVNKIDIGDKVAMKASFLRSTGQYTGTEPFKRGEVKEIKLLGDITIAKIDWGKDGESTVAVSNLSKITARGIADE